MTTAKGLSPLYTPDSKVLILGTFPSQTSRDANAYYTNNTNRFWKVICTCLGGCISDPYDKKIQVLKDNDIALWDLIDTCEIEGSKDSTIKNPVFNDIHNLLNKTDIELILLNGKTNTLKWYEKNFKELPVHYKALPSTSLGNRSFDEYKWVDAISLTGNRYNNAIKHYIKLMGDRPIYKTETTNDELNYIFSDYWISRSSAECGVRSELLKEALIMKIKRGKI